jgi:acyl-CoA thioesterase I
MKCRGVAVVLALALAACGDEAAPVPEAGPSEVAPAKARELAGPERRILAFGDSLFAGYGVGERASYPAQLEAALRGRGHNVRVTNAGVSGDTSAAGRQRIEFVLDSLATPPDLVIVELGGNDLLRGIPPAETRENIGAILAELHARGVAVLLMGMRAPPNLGEAYVREFDGLYPDLALRHNAALVPFFLEPVYDKPALIQDDRIHPTAAGIEALVAATADDVATALPDARR